MSGWARKKTNLAFEALDKMIEEEEVWLNTKNLYVDRD